MLYAAMLAGFALVASTGCALVDVSHEPVIHNPFPQLTRIAVAPFFNQSDEPTVDGRKFALAYYAELQAVPGFEVVPLGVVEEAILAHHVDLSHSGEARRLARILNVDAVVIGSITDYTPYYPPRCGLRVEWYAANPGFHEIPAGYGLPWGTPEEEFIPESLVFEAEMAQAKASMAAQTPACELPPIEPPPIAPPAVNPLLPPASGPANSSEKGARGNADGQKSIPPPPSDTSAGNRTSDASDSETSGATTTSYEEVPTEEELPSASNAGTSLRVLPAEPGAPAGTNGAIGPGNEVNGPWIGEQAIVEAPAGDGRPPCCPNNGPVMTHTRIYHGNDGDFTRALEGYYHFRNDARFGGWQNYLQRSDDFVRFCCHMHIAEMLSARGGADQTRVVWRGCNCR